MVLLWLESQQPKAFLMDFIIPSTSTAFPAFIPAETGQRTQVPFCSPTRGGISVLCWSHGVAPAWQVSRGSWRQVLQLGRLGKLRSSRKRIKLKERLRTDGKSRQELSFDRCQEISLEVPLLCWSSCFVFPFPSCSSSAAPGGGLETRRTGQLGRDRGAGATQPHPRGFQDHVGTCPELLSPHQPNAIENALDGVHTTDIPTPRGNKESQPSPCG